MIGMRIAIFISLIFISQVFGHKIHKRLLETANEPSTDKTVSLTIAEILTTTTTPLQALTEPESMRNSSSVYSTETPELIAHPFAEATDVHHSNESDIKVLLETSTVLNLQTEKPQETAKQNSPSPKETLSILNIATKPLQIIKENCTCFSIRRTPNSMNNSQKFENATTSVLSEVESEIGILFEIASGGWPKINEITGRNTTDNSTNMMSQDTPAQTNSSTEIIESPFFEDFVPFFPLESFFGRVMPLETIIIQTESEKVNDSIQNRTDPIKMERELANPTTLENDKLDAIKKPIPV